MNKIVPTAIWQILLLYGEKHAVDGVGSDGLVDLGDEVPLGFVVVEVSVSVGLLAEEMAVVDGVADSFDEGAGAEGGV